MAATPLGRFFGKDDALSRLRDHAARLVRLQASLDRLLPPAMRGAVAVANCQEGVLTLHVTTPSLATRLKMSTETLLADLQMRGEPIQSVKMKVRPVQGRGPDPLAARETRHVGAQGREALEQLRASTRADTPLARALEKFLKDCG